MPSLKDIRNRIGSVRNTRKITKAMKMVYAAKLRRAQAAILATRPYARRIDGLIKGLAGSTEDDPHPLLVPRESVKTVGVLVITSDKGLCGGFNANILRAVDAALADRFKGIKVELALVGRKSIDFYKNKPRYAVSKTYPELYHHNLFEEGDSVSRDLVGRFLSGELDEVYVLYNEFKSAITQKVQLELLVPIVPDEESPRTLERHDYTFEPRPKRAFCGSWCPNT